MRIANDLHDVGVQIVRVMQNRRAERSDLQRGIRQQRRNGVLDHRRVEQWQVALHVHEYIARQIRRDFGQAIGSGAVIGARHTYGAAEGCDGIRDALVIGGDDHLANPARASRATVDVLDHRTTGDVGERLGWKSG